MRNKTFRYHYYNHIVPQPHIMLDIANIDHIATILQILISKLVDFTSYIGLSIKLHD